MCYKLSKEFKYRIQLLDKNLLLYKYVIAKGEPDLFSDRQA